MSNNISLPF